MDSKQESYDLVVLGGGAAGEKGAVRGAWAGKKVALIEKESVIGGAMVNTGTLPSKTLRETAIFLSGFRQRDLFGVKMGLDHQATVKDFLFRLNEVVTRERARLEATLKQYQVSRYQGTARFVDPHTIAVSSTQGEVQLHAEHVLIATGSIPNRPPLFAFEHQRIYDSDEIVNVNDLPKSLIVVGGGIIGCEYACLFAALGAQVTLVESKPTLLAFLDEEIAALLTERMQELGITLAMSSQVQRCLATDSDVTVTLSSGQTLQADAVLVAAGRNPATQALQLEKAGITLGARGKLDVDTSFRTQVPHIYAVGDVIGFPALASTAMEQARVAVFHCFKVDEQRHVSSLLPYGIYTIPEVSMVGETEASLREKGIDYVKGVANLEDNARGLITGDRGRLKLLFQRSDMKLLGVHCLGEGATEWVHTGLMAMLTKSGASLFLDACFNYPTVSDAYKYATFNAIERREGRLP